MTSATRIKGNISTPSVKTRGEILRAIFEAFLTEGLLMAWFPNIPSIVGENESESGFGTLRKVKSQNSYTNVYLYLEVSSEDFQVMLDMGLKHYDLLLRVGQTISDKLGWEELKFTENENTPESIWVNLLQ